MGNPHFALERLRCVFEARRQRSFAASSKPTGKDSCDPRQTAMEEMISRKLDALSLFAPPALAPSEHGSAVERRRHPRFYGEDTRSEEGESEGSPVYRLSEILAVFHKRQSSLGDGEQDLPRSKTDEDASSDRSRAARAAIMKARANLTVLHTNQPGSKGAVDARRRRHALAMARAGSSTI
ncbi:hypothetical protein T484DRAFT_1744987 [Baffinella frigidus]|nr:hypothetical protein T484DRAFT_1744987 [Cryptophyta sp. CCMP2293]